ncbi:MAG: hypothetical protein ACRDVG_12620 [Jatrophihabitantaceae bacterium]
MTIDQPRVFTASTNVLAYAQAFSNASVHQHGDARRERVGRRRTSFLRGHRSSRRLPA